MTQRCRKLLCVLLALVMVVALMPVSVFAAEDQVVDAAVMFSDLHTNQSNYKESTLKGIMNAFLNAGLPVSSVTSCGDAFSVNEDSSSSSGPYTGYTSTLTGYIQSVLGSVPVNYVWSDHDRYAVQADGSTLLDKKSQLVYGAGDDGVYGTEDDDNYYIFSLSMGDLCSYDRYSAGFNYTESSNSRASKGFTATVPEAIANFQAAAATLNTDRPLFITSHQPLFDNRNDNAWAEDWFDAINEVAEDMDVAFFYGHNHKYDTGSDYYYAKGSTMPVATADNWNYYYETGVGYKPSIDLSSESKTLNFTHMCAGYLEPTSTGSYSTSTTRLGTAIAVTIYEDSINYTTYNSSGVYTGNFALNVDVPRDHAAADTETEVPETTEPETTEPTEPETTEPENPDEPEVSGTIWRQATSIEAGKKYMLVNYGYNASGIDTFAVNSSAAATAVTVQTDDSGAYIVNDDQSLAWTASANSSQFLMANADTGYYLRAASYVYGTSGSDLSVNASTSSGSTYTNWSLETKNGSQVLAVRRATSGNYYPVRYTGSAFQAFNSAQVGSMTNWLAAFVETEENAHQHTYETVTVEATCTEAGSVTTTCSGCGDSYTEVIAATGHSYSNVVTAPTCESEGYTTYTCDTCGHSYTDAQIEALGHDYDCVITATCTDAGYEVYTCATCGDTYNGSAVTALGHSYESAVVEPGCTTEGYTTYVCATCGDTYTGDAVAALGHDYAAVTVEATCESEGYTTYTCKVCDHSYVGDNVAALGHDYESVVTEPTYEEEGYTTHTCKICGDVKVDSYVPVLTHDYETVTVEATCTEDGSITHTCVTCGYTYTEVIPAVGHSYTTVTTEATCTQNGSVVSTCSACEDVQTEVIPATGHSYETTVIEPDCTNAGYKTYTCACGDVVTEELAALGHSYYSEYTAPTCTEAGGTVYTCGNCGDSYTNAEAALGHSYTAESVAPTCTEVGYTTYTCAACGDSYTADEVAALGHDYTGAVTEPTCTAEGFTTYICNVCGDSYAADKVAALGHTYDQVVTEPTCTEAGYTTYTCTVCNDTYTGNAVAAIGHTYTSVESDGYLVYTCGTCGDSYSEKIETISFTKVSSVATDNRYVITLYSDSQYYALSHAGNKISVAQVTVSGDQITSEIPEELIWNYADSKLSYEDNGTTYYLYAQPASGWWWWSWWSTPTLTISSSNSTAVTFSDSKLKLGNYYLLYSYGSVSLNYNATTTYFFEEG